MPALTCKRKGEESENLKKSRPEATCPNDNCVPAPAEGRGRPNDKSHRRLLKADHCRNGQPLAQAKEKSPRPQVCENAPFLQAPEKEAVQQPR